MYCLYLIALVPVVIGFFAHLYNERIHIKEWIGGSIIAFIVAAIMHLSSYLGMTGDIEIWSGRVTNVSNYPFWIEEYEEAVYRSETTYNYFTEEWETKDVFSHYETCHRNHNQYFEKHVYFGEDSKDFRISELEYNSIVAKFGSNILTTKPRKSGFDGGDPNVYICKNETDYIIPAVITKTWSNKVKASPSSFSFPKVPEDAPLYEYPTCLDTWHSDRLIGDAKLKIDTHEFDKMNAVLGPSKKVNIIIVGFEDADANLGKLQEAKWIGGKKNDVVICYGYAPLEGNVPNICWTYCFSWCKNDPMKRNIEKMFYEGPIDNSILPKLEKEIIQEYTKREWDEFDSLKVKPRLKHYLILLGIMFLTQGGLYLFFVNNGIDRGGYFT